jgi:hypothetical protein
MVLMEVEGKSSRETERTLKSIRPEPIPAQREADLAIAKLKPSVAAPQPTVPVGDARYVRKAIQEELWKEAGGQCTFVDPKSGRRCSSRYRLEIDHIIPWAKGGQSTRENLRLLCRAHNQLAAIREYGLAKMTSHLESSSL